MFCYSRYSVALHHSVVVGLQYVIVVFPDHTQLLFVLIYLKKYVTHNISYFMEDQNIILVIPQDLVILFTQMWF